MKNWRDLVQLSATALLVCFLVVGLVGCAEQTDKTKAPSGEKAAVKPCEQGKPVPPPPKAPAPAPAQSAQPQPAPKAVQPAQPPKAAPQPSAQKPAPTVQKAAESTPKAPPAAEKQVLPATKLEPAAQANDQAREQAADLIYATIRVRMEEMIAQRAEMLKSGKSPTDMEIKKLEVSILRAKGYLTEAGEVPPEIKPPIAQ